MRILLVLGMLGGTAWGQGAVIEFRMERPVLSSYGLRVMADGSTSYGVDMPAKTGPLVGMQTTIQVQLGTVSRAKLFEQVPILQELRGKCETNAKNIAQTGAKTLIYTDGAVSARCTWNYSDNKTVTALGEEMMGLAYTLDMGKQMMRDQQFDRLGLDKDMAQMVEAVKAGRAFGLEAIAPILKAIVDDQSLLERVRTRAGKLLEQSSLSR